MNKELFSRISTRIDSYREDMIDLQRRLTAIPALSPKSGGNGEWEKMQCVKTFLKETGLQGIQEFNAPDEKALHNIRPNITTILKGKNSGRTFWVMSHVDVVPPGEAGLWSTDPYKLRVEGDKIYGRGTEDNHQGLAGSVFCVKSFIDEDIKPEVNIGLVIVSDEETGSEHGIQYMLNNYDIFKKDDLILVPDAGNNKGDMIEIAEKTMLWLKFTTIGKQCHASTPDEGRNSFRAASYLITKLDSLYQTFSKKNSLFIPPVNTFEPTKKEPNVQNVNTIPGEDIFYMDCRLLPDYNPDDIISTANSICGAVEKEFNVTITCDTIIRDEAAPPTSEDSPIVSALLDGIKAVYDVNASPAGIGGGTVASHFRKAGFNVAVWSKIAHTAHQPDEYCIIDNMTGDAKVMAHICLQ